MTCTASDIRLTLPGLLIEEQDLDTSYSGTFLQLNNDAYQCPTILKNTTTLTEGTDFDFIRPNKITLGTAADGEFFIATCYIGESDANLDTLIVMATEVVDDYFHAYGEPTEANKATFVKWLATSYYLFNYSAGSESEINMAQHYERLAFDGMKRYRDNTQFNTPNVSNSRKTFCTKVN